MTTDVAAGQERSVLLLVVAGVVVAAVVIAVVVFGVERPPALADLADEPGPAPPTRIAWTVHVDGETCVEVADSAGDVVEPWCGSPGGELVGWDAEGRLVLQTWDVEPSLRVIEVETGRSAIRTLDDEEEVPLPVQRESDVQRSARGELVVRHEGEELWRTQAPDNYEVWGTSVSPDGEWVAVVDSVDRLLVVPADASTPPRVWARDVGQPVLWEGEEPETRTAHRRGESR